MDFQELVTWFIVMTPLVISPGPANIASASVSASSGFRVAVRFILGITVINFVVSCLMGFGMGVLYDEYRSFFKILEHLGALYIIYLGYKIYRTPVKSPNQQTNKTKNQGFLNGMTFQLVNTKLYPTLAMMFSQFIDGDRSTPFEVLELIALFVVVMFVNYIFWAWFGVKLAKTENPVARWVEQYGFGILLMLVGLWLFLH